MHWENLTSDQFAKAVTDTGGVCVFPLGVVERHGPHLPLGTDMFVGKKIAELAAAKEPAVVFPPWFLGQIYEAKCHPGTITIPPKLLVENILAMFDEIGRNGFTKIVAFIAHGGNNYMTMFLAQCLLDQPKPYQVYVADFFGMLSPEQTKQMNDLREHPMPNGHAAEIESSMVMACNEQLVDMPAVKGQVAAPLRRLAHIGQAYSPFGWYANYPEHYAGNAAGAGVEKGRKALDICSDALAAIIRSAKQDQTAHKLATEFFDREAKLRAEKNANG